MIKECWSQNQDERPTFEEIVDKLKKNPDFITENVDKDEFLNYIDYIDEELLKTYSFSNFDELSLSVDHKNKQEEDYEDNILDLDQFYLCEQIDKDNLFELNRIISKRNNENYTAKICKFEINKLTNSEKKYMLQDVKISSQLKHPIFLNIIGYSPLDFDEKRRPVIVSDFKLNKRLSSFLKLNSKEQNKVGWTVTKRLKLIYGIAFGMSYLHSLNIVHLNLKSSTILLDDELLPKIAEFGLSKKIDKNNDIEYKNPTIYSAPEISNGKYSKESDAYSFTIILSEIITNEPVLNENNYHLTMNENIESCYLKLIKACMSKNSTERPTFDEIINQLRTNSNFITENVDQFEFNKYVEELDKYQNKNELSKLSKEDENIKKILPESTIG